MNVQLINADARNIPLADKSVQCVVTSPPYYGLRDYGTAKWDGGDPECEHIEPTGTILGKKSDTFHGSNTQEAHEIHYKKVCGKCGAVRIDAQIGLEPTPDEYVDSMVAVMREVKRVLKDDGVLWLNVGDSYASNGGAQVEQTVRGNKDYVNSGQLGESGIGTSRKPPTGLKPKDLIGIPWMLAFALRADGWYLRQDIIWHKPNPMPESVKDRCTKAHEYVFLLTKSARYYYDAEAVSEDTGRVGGMPRQFGATKQDGTFRQDIGETFVDNGTRNKRSVWTINTQPTKEAHFATFPEKLVEPCILAGTSARGHCPKCGAVWERKTEKVDADVQNPRAFAKKGNKDRNDTGDIYKEMITKTIGWQPTCDCGLEPEPDTVFDPFMGSGTVARVAIRLGRNVIGTELNPEYIKIAQKRIAEIQPILTF